MHSARMFGCCSFCRRMCAEKFIGGEILSLIKTVDIHYKSTPEALLTYVKIYIIIKFSKSYHLLYDKKRHITIISFLLKSFNRHLSKFVEIRRNIAMDLRVEKTKRSIINAFLKLRSQKPLEKITVKRACFAC